LYGSGKVPPRYVHAVGTGIRPIAIVTKVFPAPSLTALFHHKTSQYGAAGSRNPRGRWLRTLCTVWGLLHTSGKGIYYI